MKSVFWLIAALLLVVPGMAQSEVTLFSMPSKVAGVKQVRTSLNGKWDFQFSPSTPWTSIEVPGEAAMQGYAIDHDKPVKYKKKIQLPADYKGKVIVLRFDGVYSHARLWVNGTYVREHHGGFTRWEADITKLVPQGSVEIVLEVTDRIDDISYASGYAHHPIGGILRDVSIYALPQSHLANVNIATDLDSLYQNAQLRVGFQAHLPKNAEIMYALTGPDGQSVPLAQAKQIVEGGQGALVHHAFPISNPIKWDAEHPNLYQLDIIVKEGGKELCRYTKQVGFREVKIQGAQLLVNGKPVKLRGACRHDIHPSLGRVSTPMYDSLDAVLFKQSNMNFVRTSHYPPTEAFLNFCDQQGLYVECETAVCFVKTHRQKNYAPADTQDDPLFADRYMSQLQEMVLAFRPHPSILFWSVGNENTYGANFQLSYDWVKKADTTRPAIFSYPGSVPQGKRAYDILSMHYPGVDGTMNQWGITTINYQGNNMPALFDEWAHVPCYTYSTLQTDPNIREFWGKSLDLMWGNLFEAPGGLGGAIWGYADETFMLPEPKVGTAYWKEFAKTAKPEGYQGKCVGYGEWGIVDVWRRQKPEFWSTKKAYSPIRVQLESIADFTPNRPLLIPVYNRFDHTNLNEVTLEYTYGDTKSQCKLPSVQPRQKGLLVIPADAWAEGEQITLKFMDMKGQLIDAYNLSLGRSKAYARRSGKNEQGALRMEETAERIVVHGADFEIPFSKRTGLIQDAKSKGQVVVKSGPFLNLDINLNHLTGPEVRKSASKYIVQDADWLKSQMSCTKENNNYHLKVQGSYKEIQLEMDIVIAPDGVMQINYLTNNEPNGWLREAGLRFMLPDNISQLNWTRKGYWNYYPDNSFAGNNGSAPLYNTNKVPYGAEPKQPWQLDAHNYYYFADAGVDTPRPLTQAAKGMKENIYEYSLSNGKQDVSVFSDDAQLACRINWVQNNLTLYVNSRWDYPEIAWGDYCKTLEVVPNYGKIQMQF